MGDLSIKARTELNALYVFPGLRKIAVDANVLKEIMLYTGGDLLVNGQLYDITSKSLGAGIYQLKLKRSNP